MINKLLFAIISTVTVLSIPYASVSAHVLEGDGSIGAVLHINPDDDPIAGEETSFYFDFKDKSNKFKPEDCNCNLVIDRNGTTVYNEPFDQPSGGTFTFPARDVYKVKAVGTPRQPGSFESFTLAYDIRVERGVDSMGNTDQQSSVTTLAAIGVGSVALFALLGFLRYNLGKKSAQ